MRRNIKMTFPKKRMLILSLLILLLCTSIGYAYLSEAIKINTSANIGKIIWDVHLENIVVRDGSVSATPPVIGSDKTSITLSVTLNHPNEYYEYYVDIVNKGTIDAQIDNIFKTSLSSEQEKYIDYKITYKDGIEINRNDILSAGEKETLKVLVYIKDLHESLYPTISTNLTLEGKISYIQKNNDGITRKKNALYEQIVKEAQSDAEIDFGSISSDTNGLGVYTLTRTATYAYPIYYYRGNVTNNNVIFGNFCWKILRTTTSGGIKLIYNGEPNNGVCNNTGASTEIGKSAFNIEHNDSKYVGYMYDDNTKDSTIKGVVDSWFANNLVDYLSYLEDTPFYNERDYVSGVGFSIAYAPRQRTWGTRTDNYLETVPHTTIKLGAANASDIFSVNESIGNGKLTYPIGLITSDEVVLAGGRVWTSGSEGNTHYYLYNGSEYLTLSPVGFGPNGYIFFVGNFIHESLSSNAIGVRPVISLLRGSIYTTGNGTSNSPYIIFTD